MQKVMAENSFLRSSEVLLVVEVRRVWEVGSHNSWMYEDPMKLCKKICSGFWKHLIPENPQDPNCCQLRNGPRNHSRTAFSVFNGGLCTIWHFFRCGSLSAKRTAQCISFASTLDYGKSKCHLIQHNESGSQALMQGFLTSTLCVRDHDFDCIRAPVHLMYTPCRN